MKEEELLQLYQEALEDGDKNKGEFILTALFEKWEGKIKSIIFKIWNTCHLLGIDECVGHYGLWGGLLKCAYEGLGKAAAGYRPGTPFYSYGRKTIDGTCRNYCLRECYKGKEAADRLPETLGKEIFSQFMETGNRLAKEKCFICDNYKLHPGGYYKLQRKNLSIGKAVYLLKLFDFVDCSIDSGGEIPSPVPREPGEANPFLDSIDTILDTIKSKLSYLHILILTLIVMGNKQNMIAKFLNLPPVNITREKHLLQRELGLWVRAKFAPGIIENFSSRDFEEKIINKKRADRFLLKKKEKLFLESCYKKKENRYMLEWEEQKNAPPPGDCIIKILKLLQKVDYFPPFLLEDLLKIEYFRRRFYDEMKELIDELIKKM